MEEKTNKKLAPVLIAAGAVILGILAYFLYYYNYFSLQTNFENFLSTDSMYSTGFSLFTPYFFDIFPAPEVLKYAVFLIILTAIFAAVELKAFKIKKWVFITAPLVSCTLLMFFSYGGSLALISVYQNLNAYQAANPGFDNFANAYPPVSIAFPIVLPMVISAFILELESIAFFLLAAWDLVKKRKLNKFYLAGFGIFAAAQLMFMIAEMFLPLAG